MPSEPPIACPLSADELPARLAEMTAIGEEALDQAEVDGTHAVLRFRPAADTRTRLERVVAAESQCCAFLDMDLSDERELVVLTIDAPDGAEPVLEELVGSFRGDAQPAR